MTNDWLWDPSQVPAAVNPTNPQYNPLNPVGPTAKSLTPVLDILSSLFQAYPGGRDWRGVGLGIEGLQEAGQKAALRNLHDAAMMAYQSGQVPSSVVPYGMFGSAGQPRPLNPDENRAALQALGIRAYRERQAKESEMQQKLAEAEAFAKRQGLVQEAWKQGGNMYARRIAESLGLPWQDVPYMSDQEIAEYNAKSNRIIAERSGQGGGGEDERERRQELKDVINSAQLAIPAIAGRIKEITSLLEDDAYVLQAGDAQLAKDRAELTRLRQAHSKVQSFLGTMNYMRASSLGLPTELVQVTADIRNVLGELGQSGVISADELPPPPPRTIMDRLLGRYPTPNAGPAAVNTPIATDDASRVNSMAANLWPSPGASPSPTPVPTPRKKRGK